jgi:hypothetical protein
MAVEVSVNYWAVLAAMVANMALGFAWYSQAMFGKDWIALMGWDPKKMKKPTSEEMTKSVVGGLIAAGVMAYVLSHFADYAGAATWLGGMQLGFWVWLGFVATVTVGGVLWERKPWKLYFINSGYWLVALLVMGAIIGGWQ